MDNVLPHVESRIVGLMASALGPELMAVFVNPRVNEVYVNPGRPGEPMELWSDGRDGKKAAGVHVQESSVEHFLSLVSSERGESLKKEAPHVQAQLPYGHPFHGARLQGVIPPVVSQATFVIRKHSAAVFDLDRYVEFGSMTQAQREAIGDAVANHENIVVAGGTGSGKTTLTNAVLAEIARVTPDDRVIVLEDTPELQCEAADALHMRTSPEVSMKKLVYLTLRCTPNRIVVGEVRDDAAYDLLDAWATGHPGGVCTVHAETPMGALSRLHRLASHGDASARHHLIAESVGVVAIVERRGETRRIAHLVRVGGWSPEHGYELTPVLGASSAERSPQDEPTTPAPEAPPSSQG